MDFFDELLKTEAIVNHQISRFLDVSTRMINIPVW